MANSRPAWVCAGLTALMVIAGLWALAQLPADAQVPVHFNYRGVADSWASPRVGLFVCPAIAIVLCAMQVLLPRIDPRGQNLVRSGTAYGTIFIAIVLMMALLQAIVICAAMGVDVEGRHLVPLLMPVMLIVVGNVMGKLRWNYTVGIRAPWTLADERVWDKTHRFGGRALLLGGIVTLAAAFVPGTPVNLTLLTVTVMTTACLASIARSYVYWRSERHASA